ncbi:hypothetical protein [Aliiruegeria lutimaris]|uniref:hypothetical protein n=1 Tax=Aliiruegeria lutimaris TaxID=571298 RepID=UPI000B85A5DB|nr:hypothetical protein [Aliiruegeria lutimaris]
MEAVETAPDAASYSFRDSKVCLLSARDHVMPISYRWIAVWWAVPEAAAGGWKVAKVGAAKRLAKA